jgi:GNAT superfamily N-acetyltransferase
MLRNAIPEDLNFIHKLILDGARNGHFNPEFYLNSATNNGLKKNLESILKYQKRLDTNVQAYTLVSEEDGKPTSFMIISALEGAKGNEIWMMSTEPQHQRKGIASDFLDNILRQFKNGNRSVFVRCEPASEIMYKLLVKSGFEHLETSARGTRILGYNLK